MSFLSTGIYRWECFRGTESKDTLLGFWPHSSTMNACNLCQFGGGGHHCCQFHLGASQNALGSGLQRCIVVCDIFMLEYSFATMGLSALHLSFNRSGSRSHKANEHYTSLMPLLQPVRIRLSLVRCFPVWPFGVTGYPVLSCLVVSS